MERICHLPGWSATKQQSDTKKVRQSQRLDLDSLIASNVAKMFNFVDTRNLECLHGPRGIAAFQCREAVDRIGLEPTARRLYLAAV